MKKRYTGISLLLSLCFSTSLSDVVMANQKTKKPLRQGFPGRRVGAGTRDALSSDPYQLTALIPESNLGLSTNPTPSLYLYFPKTTQPKLVELVVRDDQDQQVKREILLISPETELSSLTLAQGAEALPLDVNRNYHWYVSIILDPDYRSKDIVVDGWIRRVESSTTFQSQLANANSELERVELYQQADIWQDAVAELAQLHLSHPNDQQLTARWYELLNTLGFEGPTDQVQSIVKN